MQAITTKQSPALEKPNEINALSTAEFTLLHLFT